MPKKKAKKEFKISKKNLFALAILLILLSAYMFLSFFSYLGTWQTDNIKWIDIFSGSDVSVNNFGGKLGAYLAYNFITGFLGIASFGVPFLLMLYGLRLLKIRTLPLRKTTKVTILLMIWLSLILGYVDLFLADKEFLLGGLYGYSINLWLASFIGNIGVVALWTLVSFLVIINIHEKFWEAIHNLFYSERKNEKKDEENGNNESVVYKKITTEDFKENKKDTSNNVGDFAEEELSADNNDIREGIDVFDSEEDSSSIENEGDPEFEIKIEEEPQIRDGDHITVDTIFDPTQELSGYKFPTIDLLKDYNQNSTVDQNEIQNNKTTIIETLKNYNIEITKITANVGPTVTMYEIKPAPGIKISRIKSLENDIALSLSALGIRIIAPIPGKDTIGIEVPNKNAQIVAMKTLLMSKDFQKFDGELPVVLGKTIDNKIFTFDLASMPHLLVAGATGQGKSVGLNVILASLLYKKHPTQLKFILIDPKQVEFSLYNDLKNHFLATMDEYAEDYVITDTDHTKRVLLSLVTEMELRYNLLKKARVRNIKEYNEKFFNRKLNPQQGHRFLPYIVIVIDEFADLIMMAGKEIEVPIARIAQKARAVGMHMIIATQRPSTNVITGLIKANFPARIAFRVTSNVDSRTILDSPGAEKLIGKGDLLFSKGSGFIRVQCGFLSTEEVEHIVDFIKEQSGLSPFVLPEPEDEEGGSGGKERVSISDLDPLFDEVARYVVESQSGSTSMIQRKFSVGFNRAGKIMDQLEAAKIVGPAINGKPRKVLVNDLYVLEQILNNLR